MNSEIARSKISEIHSVLGMDENPLRFVWQKGIMEAKIDCWKRRRKWLIESGNRTLYSSMEWHFLPSMVREKLEAAYDEEKDFCKTKN